MFNTRYHHRRKELKTKFVCGGILSNKILPTYGLECGTCKRLTPFDNKCCCDICGSYSVFGDPYWDDFDEYWYNIFIEKVITLERKFKMFNNTYYYYKWEQQEEVTHTK